MLTVEGARSYLTDLITPTSICIAESPGGAYPTPLALKNDMLMLAST